MMIYYCQSDVYHHICGDPPGVCCKFCRKLSKSPRHCSGVEESLLCRYLDLAEKCPFKLTTTQAEKLRAIYLWRNLFAH